MAGDRGRGHWLRAAKAPPGGCVWRHQTLAGHGMTASLELLPSVVVLGSLHLDVMVQAPGRPRLGETMVGRPWPFMTLLKPMGVAVKP